MLKLDLRPEAFAGVRSPAALCAEVAAKKAKSICESLNRTLKLADKMRRDPDPDIRRMGEELREKVRNHLDFLVGRKEVWK